MKKREQNSTGAPALWINIPDVTDKQKPWLLGVFGVDGASHWTGRMKLVNGWIRELKRTSIVEKNITPPEI